MKKLLYIFIPVVILILILVIYSNIYNFKINNHTLENSIMPQSFDGLKIVQFSDILYNDYYTLDDFEKLVNEINELEPDIVFFTGDLVDKNYDLTDLEQTEIIKHLSNIEVNLYKYSIYGDNDLNDETRYKTIMDESKFILLDNKSIPLFYKDNTPIIITGLKNTDDLEMSYTLEDDVTGGFNITLVHKPDDVDKINKDNTIYMAGHSIGGYVNIPFIGPILNKEGAKKYTDPYYELNSSKLYVSNGLGVQDYPFRILNTSSINIYNLKYTGE